ncbi:MAG: hypothetical protein AB1801_17745 [Chloroflexota bacterium]
MQIVNSPTEQTTALTDALLAGLALGCVWYLGRLTRRRPWKANIWSWAMGLLALAAALGAIVHGVVLPAKLFKFLWNLLYLSLGLTVALFVVGVIHDGWGARPARRGLPAMLIVGCAFFGVTLLFPGSFLVFILYEAAAMSFALAAYGWLAFKRRLRGAGWMAAGILITLIAAGVQASESVSLTFIWPFDYNGLYHLIQMVGLLALMAGLRADLQSRPSPE